MMIFCVAERIMPDKKGSPLAGTQGWPCLVGLLSLSDIARDADEEYARGATNRYVTDAESRALGG
jgi:hypothetical protein